jgi:predicted extracellular nuclease
MFRSRLLTFVVFVSMLMALVPLAQPAAAASTTVVISQVYGGGGNAGATFKNDFIELYNLGAAAIDVSTWSVQYGAATGTSWQKTNLSGSIAPGRFYLIQEGAGTGGTVNLPIADASGTIAMSATAGKIALVNNQTVIGAIACPIGGTVVDFVGYGTTANCFEGAGPTPAPSNPTAVIRSGTPPADSDNNNLDFGAGAPRPRNQPLPAVASTTPSAGATGVATGATITIQFNESASVDVGFASINCEVSGSHASTASGGPQTYVLTPTTPFARGEVCIVTVQAIKVTDGDTPPEKMGADYSWSFTTLAADAAPAVSATSPTSGATGVPTGANVTITFSEPVTATDGWFSIICATSGTHSASASGGPTTFSLDPDADFTNNESCTVTVLAANITDQDTIDPPDNMAADYSFTFTVVAPTRLIHEIQGAAHRSPFEGKLVGTVPGIVIAKRSNGFNLQDPQPDANEATSEGIFVFTGTAPTSVAIGDAVTVNGSVSEFRPGGAATNLTTTEIVSPQITVVSEGNPLPAATVIGLGGRMPPTSVIEDDATTGDVETSGVFDPANDGLDFYESLEGMLVQINDPVIVGPTNSFNEIPVLPDNGSWAGPRTAHGGILYSYGDGNPERIIVDDAMVSIPGGLNVGDHFAGFVIGVVDYNFGLFMVELTQTPVRVPGLLAKETTAVLTVNELTVATFNVQNLDPGDGMAKFDTLAGLIVNNMKSPDLIAVEEVQDNTGPTNDGTVDPSVTVGTLITAITTAGGPMYSYRQINPVNDQDGGEPGGNIRQIFLFRTDRGLGFVDRPGGDSTTATTVANSGGIAQLSFSPGRIDPTNTAWSSSRKPLAAEFVFNGQRLYVIANHFNSKGGDQPLTGRFQPPVRSSEVQRHQQATIEADFVQQIRAIDANANVVVLGDLNDFEFSDTIHILEAAGLTDLYETVPLAERYSYVFEGNSQTLDHILVSGSLLNRSTLDVVHVNAEFADQASDHDPSVVRILMNDESTLCALAQRVVTKTGVANSLCAKLDNAAAARNRGDLKAAQNILKAFMNEVNAQRGKAITTDDADLLILLAGRL